MTPDELMTDPSAIENAYQIGSQNPNGPTASPTHAILGDASQADFFYGGNVQGGSGTELTTYNQIPATIVMPLKN